MESLKESSLGKNTLKGSLTPNNHDGLAPAEPEPETGASGLRGLYGLGSLPLRLGLKGFRVCANFGFRV